MEQGQKQLHIKLSLRKQVIQGVEVTDLDRRAQNLAEFKQLFLGTNTWGQNAKILNEDDLIFSRDFGELHQTKDLQASASNYAALFEAGKKNNKKPTPVNDSQALNLKVNAKAPLIIELPDLGYRFTGQFDRLCQ